jgi:hypothetical protein
LGGDAMMLFTIVFWTVFTITVALLGWDAMRRI